jgi:hypothetical protein
MTEQKPEPGDVGRAIDRMRRAMGHFRVVPSFPNGRNARTHDAEVDADFTDSITDEESSVRALFIVYEAASGEVSERRITVRQLVGNPPQMLLAWCHERKAPRNFRFDRIVEAIDPETGEVYDVARLGEMLSRDMIPVDLALRRAINILVFLARCDGHEHPREWEAIEESLGRYLLRFGGTDADHERAYKMARQVAPNGDDVLIGLRSFHASESRVEIARWLEQSMAAVIDADGTQHDEEFEWVIVMRDFIDTMRWGNARR